MVLMIIFVTVGIDVRDATYDFHGLRLMKNMKKNVKRTGLVT
jgi:hypothetical protein